MDKVAGKQAQIEHLIHPLHPQLDTVKNRRLKRRAQVTPNLVQFGQRKNAKGDRHLSDVIAELGCILMVEHSMVEEVSDDAGKLPQGLVLFVVREPRYEQDTKIHSNAGVDILSHWHVAQRIVRDDVDHNGGNGAEPER